MSTPAAGRRADVNRVVHHELDDASGCRAERQADAEFARARAHEVRHHAVDADIAIPSAMADVKS